MYRHFIENKYRYIKLTAVIIFTAIFNAFCTSFGFVLRAENNDCLVTLLAFVFAFKTKAVVCSSARFGIYEKSHSCFAFFDNLGIVKTPFTCLNRERHFAPPYLQINFPSHLVGNENGQKLTLWPIFFYYPFTCLNRESQNRGCFPEN